MPDPDASTSISISEANGAARRRPLAEGGARLGRSVDCDVVLESPEVSRRHARLYRDPFGRWVVEDLGSRNGVWVGSRRVTGHALLPGEKFRIGPYTLMIESPLSQEISSSCPASSARLSEDLDRTQVTGAREDSGETLTTDGLKVLNGLIDRLSDLSESGALYVEACAYLSSALGAAAVVVVRVPRSEEALPPSPTMVACDFTGARDRGGKPPGDMHLSRRVLEAARSSGRPVTAGNVRPADGRMGLTVLEDDAPRVVFCAKVSEMPRSVDLLYLELSTTRTRADMLDLVQAASRQLSFARKSLLLAESRSERRLMDEQLSLAREIQNRLLPRQLDEFRDVDVALSYQPAMWVGGDYCDVWKDGSGRVVFALGDVSGKGLPAAMVMSNIHAALRTLSTLDASLCEIVERLNAHLCRHLAAGMFVTMVLGLYDASSGRLECVNAGHIPPLLVGEGRCTWLDRAEGNPPLGVVTRSFSSQTHDLSTYECLLVVTDGILEALSAGDHGPEGLDRFASVASTCPTEDSSQLVTSLLDATMRALNTKHQSDDMSLFALRRPPR